MNRRDFLKNALTVAALAPFVRLDGKAIADGGKLSDFVKERQVSRRRYKNSAMTLPMLGFGMMRLPRIKAESPEVDYAELKKQIELALEAGVNYFDTAYFYHRGLSEKAVGDVLSKFPRDSYYLADKMPVSMVKKSSDLERIFNEQLSRTKAGYFDFYLLHALNGRNWKKAKEFKVYEFLKNKQKEGKIRKLGFSFHDTPEVLAEIAKAYPWDFAQIQVNYLDWTKYKSKEQYDILTALGIPVIVMEPLRGGALANLPPDAAAILKNAVPSASAASWAFRYVGSLPNVICALSGMTKTEHLQENIQTFTDFKPLTSQERKVIDAALSAYLKTGAIPCTDCRYCMPCPAGVNIPGVFALYNQTRGTNKAGAKQDYGKLTEDEKASSCVNCGACLKKCPQHINIPAMLKKAEAELKSQFQK